MNFAVLLRGLYLYMVLFFFVLACKKKIIVTEPAPQFKISLSHRVDSAVLSLSSQWYTNAAGNTYRVRHLRYFISNLILKEKFGVSTLLPIHWLVDAENYNTWSHTWAQDLAGSYSGISFYIGVDSASNITDSLGTDLQVQNMAWPDAMGGGYHFLQFEGDYISNDTVGFALHLGRNPQLVKIDIDKDFLIQKNGTDLKLTMNVSEWFKNPYVYNLDADGNYIMGNDTLMQKIAKNGSDVFQIY